MRTLTTNGDWRRSVAILTLAGFLTPSLGALAEMPATQQSATDSANRAQGHAEPAQSDLASPRPTPAGDESAFHGQAISRKQSANNGLLSLVSGLLATIGLPLVTGPRANYGANLDDPGEQRPDFIATQQAGFGWVRIWVWWRFIEQTQGDIDWSGIDNQVRWARSLGMHIYATVHSIPTWAQASGPGTDPNCQFFSQDCSAPPKDPHMFPDFMTALAQRYGSQIDAYGIWNEPGYLNEWGGGNSSSFISQILIPGSNAVKAVNSNLVVGAADLDTYQSGWQNWARDIAKQSAYYDIYTMHAYGAGVSGTVNLVQQAHSYAPSGKHFWIAEMGFSDCNMDDQTQANYVSGVLRQQPNYSWWEKTFIYTMHSWTTCSYSLLLNGNPKPAYYAVQSYLLSLH